MEQRHVDDLVSWIVSDYEEVLKTDPQKIFEAYGLNEKRLKKASAALEKLANAALGMSSGNIGMVSLFAPEPGELVRKKFCEELVRDAKKQMGDDHFFITEIVGDSAVGYTIRMRRIYTLPADSCFVNYSSMQSSGVSGVTAYRISRLTPYYKFKAAQLFAHQFSRIGLPDETTALSELAVADMAFRFQGGTK